MDVPSLFIRFLASFYFDTSPFVRWAVVSFFVISLVVLLIVDACVALSCLRWFWERSVC